MSPKTQCLYNVCIGDGVFLKNDSGEDREGIVKYVFANGIVMVSYYYDRTYEVFRDVRNVSKTGTHTGPFTVGQSVVLVNDSGEYRVGEIVSLSAQQAKINYFNNSTHVVYRHLSQISRELSCIRGICKGDKVHLYNDSGEDREGIAEMVFENGLVYISYYYNRTHNVWRLAGSVSDSKSCSPLK